MQRRQFLSAMVGGTAVLGATRARAAAAGGLSAGEGVVDITPPLGIELAGFHKPPGQERRVKGIRQPTEVRALVLTYGPTQVAVCSLDILGLERGDGRAHPAGGRRADGDPGREYPRGRHARSQHADLPDAPAVGRDVPGVHGHRGAAHRGGDRRGPGRSGPGRTVAGQVPRAGRQSQPHREAGRDPHRRRIRPPVDRRPALARHDAPRPGIPPGGQEAGPGVVSLLGPCRVLCRRAGRARLAGRGGPGDPQSAGPAPVVPPGSHRRREPRRRQRLARRDPPNRGRHHSRLETGDCRRQPAARRLPAHAQHAIQRAVRYGTVRTMGRRVSPRPEQVQVGAVGRRRFCRRLVSRQ